MKSFFNPEFWLSLSFLLVMGIIFFSPVRQRFKNFLGRQRHQVEEDIQNAQDVYKQALQAHQALIKELKTKSNHQEFAQQIKQIQKEWNEKLERQLYTKKQDFEMRQNLMELQIKNHLRDELLKQVESKIISIKKKTVSEKEIAHFIKMLDKNESLLKKSF